MKKVAVIGGSGYTGREILKILTKHPKVQVSHITADTNADKDITELHPELRNLYNMNFEKYDWQKIKKDTDIVFLCLPHGTAMNFAADAYNDGKIVIDLSADFRIKDVNTYENWYQVKHQQQKILQKAVYGIPEINRAKIKESKIIANPGCYATSMILPLYPLIKEDIIELDIIVDAKSGVSGAGKKLALTYLYNEQNENFLPYNPGKHRHTPEVIENLKSFAGKSPKITFVPHLLPLIRGILSTIYTKAKKEISFDLITGIYQKYYGKEQFIRLLPEGNYPTIKSVANSNFCDLGFSYLKEENKLILISSLDNLTKGASGQAVQNMNVILGFEENLGLK